MNTKPLWLVLLALLAGCSKNEDGAWLGYAEGDYAYIAAPTAGWVTSVAVNRGDNVARGAALFTLDADSQVAARDEASAAIAQSESQLKSAEASLDLATKELKRKSALLKTNATTKQLYDQAKSTYDSAVAAVRQYQASRDAARASLANAAYQLSQRSIRARTAGRVENVYFRQGEYAAAQTPVISLLPPENIYVRFFVPERQYAKLHLGQKVRISCDGCSETVATVSFVASSYEYAPPVVFSIQSRDKLVFKAEARVPGGFKLHPGQPVDVTPL
jgi:HlyD family secretion protein